MRFTDSTVSTYQTRRNALIGRMLVAVRGIGRLGFGRQAAVAAARRAFPARAHTPARRAISLFVGSGMIGVGVALLRRADLGVSPYDVLVSGLQPRLGISFGQTVWLISAFFFAIAALFRKVPSRWGVAYVLANGLTIDAVDDLINAPESLVGRWLFVALSIVILSSGISLVVHSGSTGGAFELLMQAGEERGFDRRKIRTSLELSVLSSGIALGGSFGPATLAIALAIGPMLGVTGQVLADHSRGRITRQIESSPQSRHPSARTRV